VPTITIDKTSYTHGQRCYWTGTGFTPNRIEGAFVGITKDNGTFLYIWAPDKSGNTDANGNSSGNFLIPVDVPAGPQKIGCYDFATSTYGNYIPVTVSTCTEGTIEILEYCPDGVTWKRRRRCVGGQWVEESQTCPTEPPPTKNGYVLLTIINKSTNDTRSTTVTGCPPPTACTSPLINVVLGQTLRAEGYLYHCDGSAWKHAALGDQTAYIKSGACGDPGEDHTYGSGTVGGLPAPIGGHVADDAWFQTEFSVSQGMIDWITRQTAAGHRSSLYANLSVEGYGWYSGEVALDTVITPPPPTGISCEDLYPNRGIDLWQAIGYGFCVAVQPGIALFKYVIDNTEWFWGPVTRAIGNIKIEVPPFIFDLEKWFKDFPALVTSYLEWLTNPSKKLGEAAVAFVTQGSDSPYQSVVNALRAGYVQVPAPTPPWYPRPITWWVNETVKKWVADGRKKIVDLAIQHVDNPEAFNTALTETMLLLETDAIASAMDLEAASIGLFEAGGRLVDVALNYIGGGAVTKIWQDMAVQESIRITSQQYWADKFRKHLPGTGDVINQVVKEIIPLDEFKRLMGLHGYSDEQAQRIWDAHFIAPARNELTTALRRGKISKAAWNRLKVLVDLDPRYDSINTSTGEAGEGSFSIWDEMVYEDPGIMNLRFMFESGSVTEAQLPDYLKALGYRPEHLPAMVTYITEYQSRFFRRRQLTLLARMVKAGKITEAEFITRAKAIYYTEKTARYELENQALAEELGGDVTERIATLGTLNTWYLEDIIDASTYRDMAEAIGYKTEFLDLELAYLDKKKAGPTEPGERQATLAMWGTWYIDDIIDAAQYREAITALGYDEITVTRQLAELDLRKSPPPPVEPRDAALANLNSWYMEDIIDVTQYRSAAEQLRYTSDFIDSQLAYLDKKKAPAPPPPEKIAEATRAMYDTFYMEDIIDAAAWRDFYVAQKYPIAVIELQLAYLIKKKTPPVDGDGPLPAERDLLQSEAIAAFKKHVIDETTLRDRLDKLGRSDDAINVLVAVAKADMATETRGASQAIYSKAYRQGAMDRATYKSWLTSQEYTDEAVELIIQTEEQSWATGVETLTQTQILNSWELGFMDDEQVQKRLKATGLGDVDMRILLSNSVLDQLKAKHLTSAEADKKWTDFGVGPAERAKLLTWYGWTPT
jgi:hypothetical protein